MIEPCWWVLNISRHKRKDSQNLGKRIQRILFGMSCDYTSTNSQLQFQSEIDLYLKVLLVFKQKTKPTIIFFPKSLWLQSQSEIFFCADLRVFSNWDMKLLLTWSKIYQSKYPKKVFHFHTKSKTTIWEDFLNFKYVNSLIYML